MPSMIRSALIGALTLAVLLGGLWWYGDRRENAGYARAQLEAEAAAAKLSEQYRAEEQAAQQQSEEEYAKYRGHVLATQKRAADLDAAAGRLRAQLAGLQSRRAAQGADASARADAAAGPDIIGVIAACAGRYDEVVRYAAQLADQVTGLQGYINAALGARR